MKCDYAKWNDGTQPCCTHECDGCVWCIVVQDEDGKDEKEEE